MGEAEVEARARPEPGTEGQTARWTEGQRWQETDKERR